MSHSLQTHVALLTEAKQKLLSLAGSRPPCLITEPWPNQKHPTDGPHGGWHQHWTCTCISQGRPSQHCKLTAVPAVRSMCELKPRFLQSKLNGTATMGRTHLQHLSPTRSWITSDNHEPPDAGAHPVVLFTISVSVGHRGLQQEPHLPLLRPFHGKPFHEALALKLAKVDRKCYKPNHTAGKNNKELVKVHRSLL